MADKLLIRAYNVELGDCIYVRIPRARTVGGQTDDFHILIDCGSWGGVAPLKAALENLKTLLPRGAAAGAKRLDLLVATHEHKDHILGFDPDFFDDLEIGAIWMTCAMDEEHPQAGEARRLHQFAAQEMQALAARGVPLDGEVADLVALFGIDNAGAMKALRQTFPAQSREYVHAGMSSATLGLPLQGATIHVLGPEKDIDHFYLGDDVDEALRGFMQGGAAFRGESDSIADAIPTNISRADFERLQARMMSNSLAFAEMSGKVTNNTSVVILIEWRGKRLLFVGDAEWNKKFKAGKQNGAWNVMWNRRRPLLDGPIDFLKIGHHGSENSTPWNDTDGPQNEPGDILDAILPLPQDGRRPTAKAVVSTIRKNYKTIPRSELLAELGQRVSNTKNYKDEFRGAGIPLTRLARFGEFEKDFIEELQPVRTDCEQVLTEVPFVDVEIEGP